MKVDVKTIVFSSLFAALVLLATMFLRIQAFSGGGYLHVGDAFVFAAGAALPLPFAMAVVAIGAGLADVFVGLAIYAPWTIVIKVICATVIWLLLNRGGSFNRIITALCICAIISMVGYFIAIMTIINTDAALLSILETAGQVVVGGVIFLGLWPIVQMLKGRNPGDAFKSPEK